MQWCYIYHWKSRGLSDQRTNSIKTSDYGNTPNLSYYGTKIRVEINGSCLKQDKAIFNHRTILNICIVYDITRNFNISSYPTLENCLFGAISLIKGAAIDHHKYFRNGIGINRYVFFSHASASGGTSRNVIIFGVDMSSSSNIDNRKKKDILILGKGPTQGFKHTLRAEKKYSINFIENRKTFYLRMHCNGAKSYLFVNNTEIHKFKAKDSEIVTNALCWGNISKDWPVDNMRKTGLNGYVYDFTVDYNAIAVDDILDIHRYSMKKNDIIQNVWVC